MRFHFPNLERPKKAAKRIASRLAGEWPLYKVQAGIAVALGYRDWHELDLAHAASAPTPLDQDLAAGEFRDRSADVVMRLAAALGISGTEAQYVLLPSRLTGDRTVTLDDQFDIRMQCWRATGVWPSAGHAGTVVRHRIPGWGPRRLAMLTADFDRSRSGVAQIITDNRCGTCVRDEFSIPRAPLPAFIPDRLRFIYGVWTEPDGAKVLFARDYAPMWRLREGQLPQQVPATDWIKFVRQEWFWEDATAPWNSRRRIEEEEARLKSFGIDGLPQLVDILPLMVASTGTVEMPMRHLDRLRRWTMLAS